MKPRTGAKRNATPEVEIETRSGENERRKKKVQSRCGEVFGVTGLGWIMWRRSPRDCPQVQGSVRGRHGIYGKYGIDLHIPCWSNYSRS